MSAAGISIAYFKPRHLPGVENLFGEHGACGGCWCMHWRVEKGGRAWEVRKGARNRADFLKLARSGKIDAVIASDGGDIVGWCSLGPAASFPRLAGARSLRRQRRPDTWSIVCFFVRKDYRRSGLATTLLQAATDYAFEHGAGEVEGFPISMRGDRNWPGPFVWTGVDAMFAGLGFTRTKWETPQRRIHLLARSERRESEKGPP